MHHKIANTGYANEREGWKALVRDLASNMEIDGCSEELAEYMAKICRWNDRSGEWSREDGQTLPDYCQELHAVIVEWAQDLV